MQCLLLTGNKFRCQTFQCISFGRGANSKLSDLLSLKLHEFFGDEFELVARNPSPANAPSSRPSTTFPEITSEVRVLSLFAISATLRQLTENKESDRVVAPIYIMPNEKKCLKKTYSRFASFALMTVSAISASSKAYLTVSLFLSSSGIQSTR